MIDQELRELLDQYGLTEEDFHCFFCEVNDDCDIAFDPFERDCECLIEDRRRKSIVETDK